MTQIHGNLAAKDRLDDSATRQKRLLQDLERQWLDTWGQARQLQSPASIPTEAWNAVADAGASTHGVMPAAESSAASSLASHHVAGAAISGTSASSGDVDTQAFADAGNGTGPSAVKPPNNAKVETSSGGAARDSRKAGPAFELGQADTRFMSSSQPSEPGSTERATASMLGQQGGVSVAPDKGVQVPKAPSSAVGSQRLAPDATSALEAPAISAPNQQGAIPGGAAVGMKAEGPSSMRTAEPVARRDADVGTPVWVQQGRDPGVARDGITAVNAHVGSGYGSVRTAYPEQALPAAPAVRVSNILEPAPLATLKSSAQGLHVGGGYGPVSTAYPEQASPTAPAAGVTNILEPAPLATLKSSAQGLPAPVGEGDATPARQVRRHFSAASQDTEPAPQHLMLRELSDQEVLASMRDVQLGSHESQMAAQELARALMQAGYARVQVVVNGYQRKHGDPPAEGAVAADGGQPAENAPQTTSSIPPTRHGN